MYEISLGRRYLHFVLMLLLQIYSQTCNNTKAFHFLVVANFFGKNKKLLQQLKKYGFLSLYQLNKEGQPV